VPTVRELSDPYANFMLNPVPPGTESSCSICLTFTDGFARCYNCQFGPQHIDGVLPISYSVHLGQLHTALYSYKRSLGDVARRFQADLSAVLWRFLEQHEQCLAAQLGIDGFDLVTTVPSSSTERDQVHPLRHMVGSIVQPTRDRYERLLVRSGSEVPERTVDLSKFSAERAIEDETVLLIDDTWTTGANVQSAAGSLKDAGASRVGAVVIGRHIHDDYHENETRLRELPRPFNWTACALD
jgi:predicted amidophosphoribosyltransferase